MQPGIQMEAVDRPDLGAMLMGRIMVATTAVYAPPTVTPVSYTHLTLPTIYSV